jgi:hypothetical protein
MGSSGVVVEIPDAAIKVASYCRASYNRSSSTDGIIPSAVVVVEEGFVWLSSKRRRGAPCDERSWSGALRSSGMELATFLSLARGLKSGESGLASVSDELR